MQDAVGLFLAMDSQWRWTGLGLGGAMRTGLDYTALAATASLSGVTMTPALFNDIRTLELAALNAWNKKNGRL